ncbi:rhamnan synthesis F family protein [Pseudomonas sp. CCI1.2]|uniref:rhamnan synthesis F family protein n=1 Tax=Pseudomonas sp. CCI1.2 TaxID=3048614 RepID=UPI002B222D9F|nr:rhamnan synthesis F family protein [Pseudomonas sp. CCI1.2]MEB0120483.1 rhamnan synthesis F family protein [Pseudomonas sp. CCI1.2]
MRKKIAVVAHFDADNILDDNFAYLLSCLEHVFDIVVLVTTSELHDDVTTRFKKVKLIKRPNIGYDFYSYRVGFEYAKKNYDVDCVLFTNSSYLITDGKKYISLLDEMIDGLDQHHVTALTQSMQFGWHVQSYLVLLNNVMISSLWVSEFLQKIEPLNTKFEIILRYEIGFSAEMLKHSVDVKVMFKPSIRVRGVAKFQWLKIIAKRTSIFDWLAWRPLRNLKSINWTHFAANDIASQFGLLKTEVIRTNPHSVDLTSMLSHCAPDMLEPLRVSVDRSKQHYQLNDSGLSSLVTSQHPLPSFRSVQLGTARAPGVRVAVVVHLYYVDLLDEILTYLPGIVEPFDLYVTTPFEADVSRILNSSATCAASVTIRVSENRGRDIGPFMSLYLSGVLDGYSAVLKLHSKKSKYSNLGAQWRKSIYDSLMGSSLVIRKTLKLFENQTVGIVGPHSYYLSNEMFWGANREVVKKIISSIVGGTPRGGTELGFFAGSMFWFAPKAISGVKKLPLSELVFAQENGMQDGTLAHAFERIFCPLARESGFITTSLRMEGSEIDDTQTKTNRVPVL